MRKTYQYKRSAKRDSVICPKSFRLKKIHYLNSLFIAPKFSLDFINLLNHRAQKMPFFIFSYISYGYVFFGEEG